MGRISAYTQRKGSWYTFASSVGTVRDPAFVARMARCLHRTVELIGRIARGRRIDKTTFEANPALLAEGNTLLYLNLG